MLPLGIILSTKKMEIKKYWFSGSDANNTDNTSMNPPCNKGRTDNSWFSAQGFLGKIITSATCGLTQSKNYFTQAGRQCSPLMRLNSHGSTIEEELAGFPVITPAAPQQTKMPVMNDQNRSRGWANPKPGYFQKPNMAQNLVPNRVTPVLQSSSPMYPPCNNINNQFGVQPVPGSAYMNVQPPMAWLPHIPFCGYVPPQQQPQYQPMYPDYNNMNSSDVFQFKGNYQHNGGYRDPRYNHHHGNRQHNQQSRKNSRGRSPKSGHYRTNSSNARHGESISASHSVDKPKEVTKNTVCVESQEDNTSSQPTTEITGILSNMSLCEPKEMSSEVEPSHDDLHVAIDNLPVECTDITDSKLEVDSNVSVPVVDEDEVMPLPVESQIKNGSDEPIKLAKCHSSADDMFRMNSTSSIPSCSVDDLPKLVESQSTSTTRNKKKLLKAKTSERIDDKYLAIELCCSSPVPVRKNKSEKQKCDTDSTSSACKTPLSAVAAAVKDCVMLTPKISCLSTGGVGSVAGSRKKKGRPSSKKRRRQKLQRSEEGHFIQISKSNKKQKTDDDGACGGTARSRNRDSMSFVIDFSESDISEAENRIGESPVTASASPLAKFSLFISAADLSEDSDDFSSDSDSSSMDSDFYDEDFQDYTEPRTPLSVQIRCFSSPRSTLSMESPIGMDEVDGPMEGSPASPEDTMENESEIITEANSRWRNLYGDDPAPCNYSPAKVRFASEDRLATVHTLGPEEVCDYHEARKGKWEEYARDRERFKNRIEDVAKSISYCLAPEHRSTIMQRLSL